MLEQLARIWPLMSPAARERIGALLRAAVELSTTLGVPAQEPGTGPAQGTIGADSTGDQAVAALQQYDARAVRFSGPTVEVLVGAGAPEVVATWQSLERQGAQRGGRYVAAAVGSLAAVYADIARDDQLARVIKDGAIRSYLASKLPQLEQAPSAGMSDGLKLVIALGVLWLLSEAAQ